MKLLNSYFVTSPLRKLCHWISKTVLNPASSLNTFGNFRKFQGTTAFVSSHSDFLEQVQRNDEFGFRGNGQSYGPVSISPNKGLTILQTANSSKLELDLESKTIIVSANLNVKEVNDYLEAKGFMLPVVPGAPLATIGGCIAADVHGKNGATSGSFGDHVESFLLFTTDRAATISLNTNEPLFRDTIGGFGLTGMIIEVKIRVVRRPGLSLFLRSIKTETISDLISNLDRVSREYDYTGAWFNINPRSPGIFNGIVFYSGWSPESPKSRFHIPNWLMSKVFLILGTKPLRKRAIRFINLVQWRRRHEAEKLCPDEIHFPTFYLPNWNRIFGKSFLERQFLVPIEDGALVLESLSNIFARHKVETPFGGLKIFSGEREGRMSFATLGLSVTVQFPSAAIQLDREITNLINGANYKEYIAKMQTCSTSFPSGYDNFLEFNELFQGSKYRSVMLNWLMGEAI